MFFGRKRGGQIWDNLGAIQADLVPIFLLTPLRGLPVVEEIFAMNALTATQTAKGAGEAI